MKSVHYISSLTPLRGIAALWVVLFHIDVSIFYRDLGALIPRESTGIFSKGYLWVDFFFLLSGFIISHVYGEQLSTNFNISTIKRFLWSRFTRLYPLHLFTLMILLVATLTIPHIFPAVVDGSWTTYFSWEAFPIHLPMLNAMNLYHFLSWNMTSWSIGAEWWTYVLCIAIIPLTRSKYSGIITTLLAAAGIIWLSLWHPNKNLDITWDYGYLRCLFEFIIGVNVYTFFTHYRYLSILKSDWVVPALFMIIALLFHFQVHDLYLLPVFIVLILSAASNTGKVPAFLEKPSLRFLGDISYSIYLVHSLWFFVFWYFFPWWKETYHIDVMPAWLKVVYIMLFVSLTIISSAFTYRNVEVNMRTKLRRLI